MRRNTLIAALGGLALVVFGVTRLITPTVAQDVTKPRAEPKKQPGISLPISQIVLFNSGMGYFQREGQIDGDSVVDLSFPVGDVNDLLRSLVLQDLGKGKISAISYDSHDPLDKILRSFALDLNNNPTFGQILNQARGEPVDILRRQQQDNAPVKLSGVIVGMEARPRATGKDTVVEVEQLNLLCADGLQGVPLTEVRAVRFVNPVLDNEFRRALQVLAGSHDVQKKTVSLAFHGDGKRPVRVGYVVERPIWKTSYRLALGKNGELHLQGWALVDNTSDDDWNKVRMVLVSGRPISYQMNLYEPLYIPRPTVEPELFASLRPPVYSGALAQAFGMAGGPPPVNQDMNQAGRGGLGIGGGIGGIAGIGGLPALGSQPGLNYVNPYQLVPNNEFANSLNTNIAAVPRLTWDELQKRRQEQNRNKDAAKKAGAAIAGLNFKEGVASVASAEEIGDYYRYVLEQEITIPRQKSAMLPILNQSIQGAKVSIFNESVQAKYPLLGLRLKNTTGQPLTQGPITVYEDASYSGDTRILDVQPGEERLLSYAIDLGIEVKTQTRTTPSPKMSFKIGADVLTAHYKLRQSHTYLVKNRSQTPRKLIIEHPVRSDWTLIEPKQPGERTRDVYRFEVVVPPGETLAPQVVEEQARADRLALAAGNKDTPPRYAIGLGIEVKPEVETSPEELVGLQVVKGVLHAQYRTRASKTYFVQNLSGQAREFVIDHVIPAEWKRVSAVGDQPGPDVYRFTLQAAAGKTAHQQVVETHTRLDRSHTLKSAPEPLLREFLASPAPSAAVRTALLKALDLHARLADTRRQLTETVGQLEALTRDQARLRDNLRIIPQSSEQFKNFLQKFVTQETAIENLQRQERQLRVSVPAAGTRRGGLYGQPDGGVDCEDFPSNAVPV